jgi:hypothetical protein
VGGGGGGVVVVVGGVVVGVVVVMVMMVMRQLLPLRMLILLLVVVVIVLVLLLVLVVLEIVLVAVAVLLRGACALHDHSNRLQVFLGELHCRGGHAVSRLHVSTDLGHRRIPTGVLVRASAASADGATGAGSSRCARW